LRLGTAPERYISVNGRYRLFSMATDRDRGQRDSDGDLVAVILGRNDSRFRD
jgi:hypothetical protein